MKNNKYVQIHRKSTGIYTDGYFTIEKADIIGGWGVYTTDHEGLSYFSILDEAKTYVNNLHGVYEDEYGNAVSIFEERERLMETGDILNTCIPCKYVDAETGGAWSGEMEAVDSFNIKIRADTFGCHVLVIDIYARGGK